MAAKKFNPYVPNGIVSPGMFTGRIDEIEAAEQALFQAQHGNAQHFIFEGERGIGKSSLIYYIDIVAEGQITGVDESTYNFLTISIDLLECVLRSKLFKESLANSGENLVKEMS